MINEKIYTMDILFLMNELTKLLNKKHNELKIASIQMDKYKDIEIDYNYWDIERMNIFENYELLQYQKESLYHTFGALKVAHNIILDAEKLLNRLQNDK